ncbi:MAG: heme-binding protein [Candidatus Methylacidiphilales bacterium]|nr:heme-binding protein [Candidatus Methylacidiphilales bacterium]
MASTPTPPTTILQTEGKFEIRQYGALTLVRAPMSARKDDAGFGKLFGFISGRNKDSKKIAMTAPVLIENDGESGSMSFIMPHDMDSRSVPAPGDPTLSLATMPAGKFAVYRYSGGRSAKNEAKAGALLQDWMIQKKLVAQSGPLFAYYDPPWIPVWFRRNEVWIRLASD